MDTLFIPQTYKTPEVSFNKEGRTLTFTGRSAIINHDEEFYTPIIDWVASAVAERSLLTIVMKLDYFSTQTTEMLIKLFKAFEKAEPIDGKEPTVRWYFQEDDEDMIEAGEGFQSIIKVRFLILENRNDD